MVYNDSIHVVQSESAYHSISIAGCKLTSRLLSVQSLQKLISGLYWLKSVCLQLLLVTHIMTINLFDVSVVWKDWYTLLGETWACWNKYLEQFTKWLGIDRKLLGRTIPYQYHTCHTTAYLLFAGLQGLVSTGKNQRVAELIFRYSDARCSQAISL